MRNELVVGVFLKHPTPGMCKSRLAATVGERVAADVATTLALFTLKQVLLGRDPDLVTVFYEPRVPRRAYEQLLLEAKLPSVQLRPQAGQDLGERMFHALQWLHERWQNAALVGTDCPKMCPSILEAAHHQLQSRDLVIGPAADGGYYLIGTRTSGLRRELFERMPWSTPRVYPLTLVRASQCDLSVATLVELFDIDNVSDLKRFIGESDGLGFDHVHRSDSSRWADSLSEMLL